MYRPLVKINIYIYIYRIHIDDSEEIEIDAIKTVPVHDDASLPFGKDLEPSFDWIFWHRMLRPKANTKHRRQGNLVDSMPLDFSPVDLLRGNFSKCRFLHQLRDRKEFIEMTMQNIQETKKSDSSVDGC